MKYTNFHKGFGRVNERTGHSIYFSQRYNNGKMLFEINLKNEKGERMVIVLDPSETAYAYKQVLNFISDDMQRLSNAKTLTP